MTVLKRKYGTLASSRFLYRGEYCFHVPYFLFSSFLFFCYLFFYYRRPEYLPGYTGGPGAIKHTMRQFDNNFKSLCDKGLRRYALCKVPAKCQGLKSLSNYRAAPSLYVARGYVVCQFVMCFDNMAARVLMPRSLVPGSFYLGL